MNRSHRTLMAVGIVLLLFCYACGKPTQQIEAAQAAFDQAKEQHAEEFAAKEWSEGQQAWSQAQAALDSGSNSQASALLLKAKTRFDRAREIAKGRREELLKEVTGLQRTVELRYGTLKTNVQAAKLSAAQKKEIDDSCKEIDQAIEKLKKQLDAGDLAPAKYTAQTTLRSVYDVEKSIPGGKK